ncbi:MAG: helix-turn-helix transcriptional regulator [Muribaculaceae bacterium]|nr:helix-turn-helix transcriptional regulator [Muribaculaceae bacterium]
MKVALIGLSALHAYGLSAFIHSEYADCEVSIYPDTRDSGWQTANCYIVSASALAILARFLMSRLDRVMLLTVSAPTQAPMQMISPLATEAEIRTCLSTLIGNSQKDEPAVHSQDTPALTGREIEVIRLTASGQTSRKIADTLNISTNTVLTHRKNIAAKTGLHTVSAITHYAMTHGLLH